MSVTSIGPVESAVHTVNTWLKELMEELECTDRERAYRALRVVLHALRDRLTVAEVADLGAQLPLVIRGLYYESWVPSGKPVRVRTKEEFLAQIEAACRGHAETFPESVAWAVFKLLGRHVSAGELSDVKHVLPESIRTLWPASANADDR